MRQAILLDAAHVAKAGLLERAPGTAVLAVVTVGIAYVITNRAVQQFGRLTGSVLPAEAQPVLIVLIFGAVPAYPYSRSWGYAPSGVLGLLLVVLLILLLMGMVPWGWGPVVR